MSRTFRNELSDACKILEDYALLDDSLWYDYSILITKRLMDLDCCVDEAKVGRIFQSIPFQFNKDGNE